MSSAVVHTARYITNSKKRKYSNLNSLPCSLWRFTSCDILYNCLVTLRFKNEEAKEEKQYCHLSSRFFCYLCQTMLQQMESHKMLGWKFRPCFLKVLSKFWDYIKYYIIYYIKRDYSIKYIEHQSFCTFVGIGSPNPPSPSPGTECGSLQDLSGERHTRLRGGVGGPNSDEGTDTLVLYLNYNPSTVMQVQ
jgi:hypothetical protein